MKTYKFYRTETVVSKAYVQAESEEEARRIAEGRGDENVDWYDCESETLTLELEGEVEEVQLQGEEENA